MHRAILAAIAIVLLVSANLAEAADINVKTVLTDLAQPTGVAIRPGGTPEAYELFVAESGSGRVLKTSSSEPHGKTDAVTGLSPAADDLSKERGGHPLLFLDERRLVIGVGGTSPDVRLYELQDGNASVTADQATQKAAPELQANADAPSGRCIALARTRANDIVADMLLIGFSGDEELKGVWKLPVRAGLLSTLSPLGESSSVVAEKPTALAVSEQGYLLIAARSSKADTTSLIFANPANGQTVLSIETSLSEIVGLAYSPKSAQLYALAANEEASGLFRIDDRAKRREPGVTETKVADIRRPTALAFAPDGALYVTALSDEDESSTSGALLKLTGDL
jgi:DNA-binding beta-propeller fold protein YncE